MASEACELIASIEASPIASIITDPRRPDNPIVAVNESFRRLTGYSPDDAVGRNCRFLAGPLTDPGSSRELARAIAAGEPAFTALVNYRKDGSYFCNAVMIAPFGGELGRPLLFLGSQMEIAAIDHGSSDERRRIAEESVARLTTRQAQVLGLMAKGLRNKEIAARLAISERTVKMHRVGMLTKAGCATSAQAIRFAVEAGL